MSMLAWMRKRMRKMLWVVAIVAAVSFGVTGVMVSVFRRWTASQTIGYVMGHRIKDKEAQAEMVLLEQIGRIIGRGIVRVDGLTYPPTTGEDKNEMVYAQIMLLALAEREGIWTPTTAVTEMLKGWYRIRRLQDILYERSGGKDWRFAWIRMSQQERKRLLEQVDEEFAQMAGRYLRRADLTWEEFKAMGQRLGLFEFYLRDLPNRMSWTPPTEAYKRFKERYHKRRLAAVWLRSDDFKFAAEACVTDKALRDFYEKVKDDYQVPERIRLECVMLPTSAARQLVKTPNDKELRQFYETIKFQPPIWDQKQKAPKPFDKVKDIVKERYVRSHAKEAAYKKMGKLLTKINETWRNKKRFEKLLKDEKLTLFETEPSTEDDFLEKNAKHFGESAKAKTLVWDTIATKEESALKRKFFGPVECEKGVFVWRLKEVAEKTYKSFKSVKDEIKKRWIENESGKIAKKAMGDIANHLRQAGGVGDSFLLERSLPVIETDFVGRYERIKELEWGRQLVSEGFKLEKIGDVSKPQSFATQKGEIWFVVVYLERQEPEPCDFERYRRAMERTWETARKWAKEWWDATVREFSPVDKQNQPLIGRKEEREKPEIPPHLRQ